MMTRANRIVLANSTFSWWGAYLSDAQEIHFPRPVRGFWSPDRPDVALEVPESRYRVVEDVPVERWRPFRVAAGARLTLHSIGDNKSALVVSGAQLEKCHVEVTDELADVCEWIASRSGSFGMIDFHDLELAPRMRSNVLKLLTLLHRHGGIEAEQGTFEAIAGTAGRVW